MDIFIKEKDLPLDRIAATQPVISQTRAATHFSFSATHMKDVVGHDMHTYLSIHICVCNYHI